MEEQREHSGENARLPENVAWVQILALTPYVGCSLLREVFFWVLWFSLLLKNQHFQITIQPGMADKEPKCGCATSKSLFI